MKWIRSWIATLPSLTHPERNEDNLWVAGNHRAAAVIDGMGGYRRQTANGPIGGEHAAALAVQVLGEKLNHWDGSYTLQDSKVLLRDAIDAINERIWQELNWAGQIPPEENPQGKPNHELTVGVALTVLALCDDGQRAVLAQHGDTHGYVLKPELGLIQVTEDQDLLLWEQINGTLTAEEAAEISQAIDQFDGTYLAGMPDQRTMRYFFDKNIFGALGVDGDCPQTGWSAIKLKAGDKLALLSDGAYSNMSINELEGLLYFPDDPASVVVELAHQRSQLPRFPDPHHFAQPFNVRATKDDMTVVVLEVG